MPKGKGATARYQAMRADVDQRVTYAFGSGDHTNPYPVEDKRHERFARELQRTLAIDAEFVDTLAVMGGDTATLVRRRPDPPGPVVSLKVLGERWLRQQKPLAHPRLPF